MVPSELRIRGVLMDKGFYNANVFKTMEDLEVDYLVPAKKFPEMKLTYRVAEVTDKWYWKYTMNTGKPNEHMTTVFLEEKGVDDYIGMVTNKDMSITDAGMLFEAYRLSVEYREQLQRKRLLQDQDKHSEPRIPDTHLHYQTLTRRFIDTSKKNQPDHDHTRRHETNPRTITNNETPDAKAY